MSSLDDTDKSVSRWPWLDWWFEPPWRALLTWVGLGGVSALVCNRYDYQIRSVVQMQIQFLDRILPSPLPGVAWVTARQLSLMLFMTWFEPFALRLDIVRGLAWIGLRIMPLLLSDFVSEDGTFLLMIVLLAVAPVAALRGWRNRPWMPVPSLILALCVTMAISGFHKMLPDWWWLTTFSVLYALPLLFGTRLLSPEERNAAKSAGV